MKNKLDELDVNNVDLSKLSHIVKDDIVKNNVYNAKIKNIEEVWYY